MVERIEDMPEGTIGFRATGKVTREEYHDVMTPALNEAAESGEIRVLYVIGPAFDEFAAGALAEDTKVGVRLGIGHHSAWKRIAVVTDVDWLTKALHMFAWATPGELMIRDLDGYDEAKAWVAEG